jgi:hypothetical protein
VNNDGYRMCAAAQDRSFWASQPAK